MLYEFLKCYLADGFFFFFELSLNEINVGARWFWIRKREKKHTECFAIAKNADDKNLFMQLFLRLWDKMWSGFWGKSKIFFG